MKGSCLFMHGKNYCLVQVNHYVNITCTLTLRLETVHKYLGVVVGQWMGAMAFKMFWTSEEGGQKSFRPRKRSGPLSFTPPERSQKKSF